MANKKDAPKPPKPSTPAAPAAPAAAPAPRSSPVGNPGAGQKAQAQAAKDALKIPLLTKNVSGEAGQGRIKAEIVQQNKQIKQINNAIQKTNPSSGVFAGPKGTMPWTPAGGGQFIGGTPSNKLGGTRQIGSPFNPYGGITSTPPRPDTPDSRGSTSVITSSTTTSEVSSAAAAAIPRQSLIPGRDVINFQTTPTSPEAMQQILFEEIAGYELVNMARRDTIEGQSDVYTVISNLSSIRREYNPVQLISLQKPNFTGFETYQVDLNNYVPGDGYLQERDLTSFYYIASNGDLIIELDNLQLDDEIEVQIANNGKIT